MPYEAILYEVEQLHNVSTRLEGLADQHPPVSEALISIAGNVRNTATIIGCCGGNEKAQADLSPAEPPAPINLKCCCM
jgi:hypothetical protein